MFLFSATVQVIIAICVIKWVKSIVKPDNDIDKTLEELYPNEFKDASESNDDADDTVGRGEDWDRMLEAEKIALLDEELEAYYKPKTSRVFGFLGLKTNTE